MDSSSFFEISFGFFRCLFYVPEFLHLTWFDLIIYVCVWIFNINDIFHYYKWYFLDGMIKVSIMKDSSNTIIKWKQVFPNYFYHFQNSLKECFVELKYYKYEWRMQIIDLKILWARKRSPTLIIWCMNTARAKKCHQNCFFLGIPNWAPNV